MLKIISTILILLPVPLEFLILFVVPVFLRGDGESFGWFNFSVIMPILGISMIAGLILKTHQYFRGQATISLSLITLFLGNIFLFIPGEDFNPYVIVSFNSLILLIYLVTKKITYPIWIPYVYIPLLIISALIYFPVKSSNDFENLVDRATNNSEYLSCQTTRASEDEFLQDGNCDSNSIFFSFNELSAHGYSFAISEKTTHINQYGVQVYTYKVKLTKK